jgi:hypothetical protein
VGFQNKRAEGERTSKDISIREEEIDMDLRIRITESQCEALKIVAEASGDSLGHSKAIKEKLYKQVGVKYG